jgi:hypothetical protein
VLDESQLTASSGSDSSESGAESESEIAAFLQAMGFAKKRARQLAVGLVEQGYDQVEQIGALDDEELKALGFKPGDINKSNFFRSRQVARLTNLKVKAGQLRRNLSGSETQPEPAATVWSSAGCGIVALVVLASAAAVAARRVR